MADNLTTTTTVSTIPSGTKISTDEDATNGHVQRMKLAYSADGVSTHVQADADGVLVNLGTNNDVTVTGTVTANLGATDNAVLDNIDADLTTIAGAVSGTEMQVDIVTGTVTANLGATDNAVLDQLEVNTSYGDNTGGGVEAGALRVTLANDSTGLLSVDDNGGSLTVDNAALSVTGGGVEASALRVTIANDSTGVVSVDDGGGSITVDGTVTETNSAAILADTANMDTNLGTVAGAVSGTEMQVDVVAALPAGTNAIGKLAANDGVDIGDVDVTSVIPGTGATNLGKAIDSAAGATDTGVPTLAVRDDALTTLTPIDGDYVPLRVNSTGALHVTGSGGGTQYNVDDAGPTVVTMAGAIRDDTLTTLTEIDGDATVLRVSSTGALHVTGGGGGTEYTDDTSTHATGSTVGNAMMAAATPTDGTVDANDMGVVAMSTDRRLHVDAQIVGQDADVTIADGGNSITVDGTVTANAGTGTFTVDGSAVTQPVSNAGLTELAAAINASQLDVNIATDSVGIGGGTEYAVDGALGATPTGKVALAKRDDALSALTPVEGDAVELRVDANGALWTIPSGTVTVDGSGVTQPVSGTITANAGTGTFTVDGSGVTQPVSGTVTANLGATDNAVLDQIEVNTSYGDSVGGGTEAAALRVTLANDSTGVLSVDDNGGSLTVDGTVTANLSATDNAVLDQLEVNTSYGDNTGGGVEAGALRVTLANDSTGLLSVDDNGGSLTVDNAALSVTGGGVEASALRVTIANDSTGVVSIDDNGGSLTVDGTVTASNTAGNVAHDAADSGNPVKVGFKAYNTDGTAPGTAVAENDRANGISDVYGRQFVETAHPNLWQAMGLYSTAQTDASVKAAPGAGLSLYITDIVVSTDTAFNCFFEQSTTKVYGTLYLAANGGASSHFRTPIKLPANTALTFTSSATANHSVTVNGYTAP